MSGTINDRKKDDQMWADKDNLIAELQAQVRGLEAANASLENAIDEATRLSEGY